ncbi:MAG: hypothetical protein AVDCRST_MAG50-2798, partial [uncultured Acidimicrobiales bacterium]
AAHAHRPARTPHRHLSLARRGRGEGMVVDRPRHRSVLRRAVLRGLRRRRVRAGPVATGRSGRWRTHLLGRGRCAGGRRGVARRWRHRAHPAGRRGRRHRDRHGANAARRHPRADLQPDLRGEV